MMCNFLTNSIESKKVSELFEAIHSATEKIEYYTKQLAMNTGDNITNVLIKCYEAMIESKVIQDLERREVKVSPYLIIYNETLDVICNGDILVEDTDDYYLTHGGPPYRCSSNYREKMEDEYQIIRDYILNIISENGFNPSDIVEN